ncbi:MAG: hypothetical protein AAB316_15430 [Bacteroidota bacterium]
MKKKQIGIWLDYKSAQLIEMNGDGEPQVHQIASNVDFSNIAGGSRTAGTPWGPQIATSDSKQTFRREQQEDDYVQEIIKALRDADEIYLFGPEGAKEKLVKALRENKDFHAHLRAVETSHDMTMNQKMQKVKAFFGHEPERVKIRGSGAAM